MNSPAIVLGLLLAAAGAALVYLAGRLAAANAERNAFADGASATALAKNQEVFALKREIQTLRAAIAAERAAWEGVIRDSKDPDVYRRAAGLRVKRLLAHPAGASGEAAPSVPGGAASGPGGDPGRGGA